MVSVSRAFWCFFTLSMFCQHSCAYGVVLAPSRLPRHDHKYCMRTEIVLGYCVVPVCPCRHPLSIYSANSVSQVATRIEFSSSSLGVPAEPWYSVWTRRNQ